MKIVLIGAGVAGLSIGWRLVQAGAEVTILERSQPGSGATGAAAGMLAVTAELAAAHGAEIEFARHSNVLWPEFAETLEAESNRVLGYLRSGALILAEDAAALARLERRVTGALKLLSGPELHAMVPRVTGAFPGALWAPQEAHVDSRALAAALAIAFQKAGGKLLTNEAVVRIERRPSNHGNGKAAIAHTPFGLYHADVFVLTAGAWSGQLEADLAPITPVKGEMIALSPPPGEMPPAPVIWGNGIYMVPRAGQLLIGATVQNAGFDTQVTDAARDGLRGAAEKLMPSLKGWALAEQWASLRPRSPDGLPLLGPTNVEGLWLAGGQYRNGILFAPAIAENLCRQILGKGEMIPAFDPPAIQDMSDFTLHPRLAADTSFAADWPLCRVLLMNDARYFWLVLVPRREDVTEITDLSPADHAQLMEEAARAGRLIAASPGIAKLNLGALGNLVPQLHWHVIGRAPGDPAWPGPVWGHSPAEPYEAAAQAARFALVSSH